MPPSFVNADFIDQHPKFSRLPAADGQALVYQGHLLPAFVGNFVDNLVRNLVEFDGLFSNTPVDKVPDEVPDKGTKV
jgi:hypothetical protein